MELIRHNQAQKDFERENMVERAIVEEPYEIDQKEEVLQMDVVMPKLIVSMKINDILQDPKEKLKRELGMNVLLDLLFARSSSLYEKWTQEGLINDSFSASFTQERDYSFLQIGGDTTKPEQLKEKILDLIEDMKDYQICEEEFNRVKKKNIGMLIGVFNSPESIANLFSRYYFEGIMIFDLIDCVSTLTLDQLNELKQLFNLDYTSTCIISPKNS